MKTGDTKTGDTYPRYMSPFVPGLQSEARIRSEPARRAGERPTEGIPRA
jgi:hypothetical protein